MSTPLRLAILVALAVSGACPAAEPPSTTAAPASAAPAPASAPADEAPLVPVPSPPSASPLQPPLLAPAVIAPEADSALVGTEAEPVDPAAAVAPSAAVRTGADVFARLRRSLAPNACDAGSNSARWRQRYAGHPVTFTRRLQSVLPLLDFVSTEVERAGLPAEFSFIPLVESWYQPAAIGPGGPAGMWQMIGTTARNHGIQMRPGYDGRLSPVESTRAALSYLNVLKHMFGDWQAIVMAYNAGEGRLQNALRRAGSRTANAAQRKPHGLSNITYDYVAKLQALSCLVLEPQRNGLRLPLDARFEPLEPMLLEPGVDSLERFARLHGQDPALLRRLNPGFRNGQVVAGVPRLVLAPPRAIIEAAPPSPLDEELVASVVEVFEAALLPAPSDDGIDAAGAPMLVPASMPAPTSAPAEGVAPAEVPAVPAAMAPDAAPSIHEVRAGDTLLSIASHYHLPVEQLLRANELGAEAALQPGQRLRLVSP